MPKPGRPTSRHAGPGRVSDGWTRLYVARWPGGTVTLLAAESLEHAADLIDEVDDAAACEVVPLAGPLWLSMRAAADPSDGPLALVHQPTREIDSQEAIVEAALPVLHRVIAGARRETPDGDIDEEPIDVDAWRAARALEDDRILSPSPEWKATIVEWWNNLLPSDSDGK